LISVKWAYVQLVALVVVGVTAIIGFHFNWWEGRKFLEIPRPLDYLVVVDVLLFIGLIGGTIWNGKRYTTTSLVLFFGLLMTALLYLPGMINTDNQTVDSYWRWWVVHLWVEGVWELIMGAILSFLLILERMIRSRVRVDGDPEVKVPSMIAKSVPLDSSTRHLQVRPDTRPLSANENQPAGVDPLSEIVPVPVVVVVCRARSPNFSISDRSLVARSVYQ
jgi:uncharacterized integral membrane protein